MLAVYTLLVLVGYAVGRLHTDALYWSRAHRPLPAATPRAIARAARRNRADLRRVLPAREQGVRVVATRPLVFRADPALGEPPSFDPFREERTR
jgi:hypothetical protein